MQIGLVTLNVRQLDTVSDYYRHLLGLDIIGRDGNSLRLGVGATPLLELRGGDFVRRSAQTAGLFHTAFLMPSRADLAALGVDAAGLDPSAHIVPTDGQMRAGDGLWAIGDITGHGSFTHVSMYQAEIAVRDILGWPGPGSGRAAGSGRTCSPAR